MVAAGRKKMEFGMKVGLIAKPGNLNTGVGRFVHSLQVSLEPIGVSTVNLPPTALPLPGFIYSLLKKLGIDLRAFLMNFPIWAIYPEADVIHLTSQNLATLLITHPPKIPVVVNVHDIIPYLLRDNPLLSSYHTPADRFFDRAAMQGLKHASRLITISNFTKRSVVENLGISPDVIDVVYLGIDHRRFKPMTVLDEIYQRYGLDKNRRYLIYVGTEDPRKNVSALIHTLAEVRAENPDIELIKVGRAHFNQERQRLLKLAESLAVSQFVHFLDDVPEADLPLLYNLADLFIMPSLYEGFGFPVLEAMACGTPVVSSNATSLPELVGDAGILVNALPGAAGEMTRAVIKVLSDPVLASQLREKGRAQSLKFTWENTARLTAEVYGLCLGAHLTIDRDNPSHASAGKSGAQLEQAK